MPSIPSQDPRIVVALDYSDLETANSLVKQLNPKRCRLKVGKEMFTRYGPFLIEDLVKRGFDVFLDLKFHDIPHQVAGACRAAMDLNVWMIDVHVLGGRRMLEAAREALEKQQGRKPLLIGVTVLTSLEARDLQELGLMGNPAAQVQRLAAVAEQAGLDGLVCSPQELKPLRETFVNQFCLVTPGIRPQGVSRDDQKRTMTPGEALSAGADYLVIGRPITAASDPMEALTTIELDMRGVNV